MMHNAYIAGLFDGEGSIYIAPNGESVQISVTQKETPILFLLKERFGGSVCKYGKQTCHKWRSHTIPTMIVFLETVEPYLFIKLTEAKIALELLRGMRIKNKGCHPLSTEERARRNRLYTLFREDRISSSKISEIQGNPDRAILSQAPQGEGAETIMETPQGEGIVRHSEESENTGSYGQNVA